MSYVAFKKKSDFVARRLGKAETKRVVAHTRPGK